MKYYEPLIYKVPPEDEGMLLRSVLSRRMKLSRKLISRIKLTERGLTVNGIRQYTNVKVKAGDLVEVRMEAESSEDILPQDLPLDIVYEDDDLLVVSKPAGMIVHPTHGHYVNTLANAVVHHWLVRGETVRFRPVHRLDQDTSGVLAIAKNAYVHQNISEQMKRGAVEKEYLALVQGVLQTDSGTVDAPIDRSPENPHVRIVTQAGYPSVTHYRVEERLPGATLLRIRLETGRTHQIRVHMKHIGHPLVGDKMYGEAESGHGSPALAACTADLPFCAIERHALHAVRLAFFHPVTKRRMSFSVPLPADIEKLLHVLRKT